MLPLERNPEIDVGDDVVFMAKPYVAAELLAACR